MEFGVFAQGAVPQPLLDRDPNAENTRLLENVEMGVFAESCGFKYVWASEHHFLREYSHLSCPEVYLSFVAARTERIHIGSAIMNITKNVNHPYRVAERVAMLDHLSRGRFEFGTGRGSSSTETGGFGIAHPDDSKVLWDEAAQLITALWREPERNILPEPYTKPHPPMWVAAGSPSTFEKAARHGLGVICFSFDDPQRLKPLIARYKEIIADPPEPLGEYVNNNVMAVNQMVVLEDRNEAFQLASEVGFMYYHAQVVRWLDSFPRPAGFPHWPTVLPEPRPEFFPAVIPSGTLIVGDPDDANTALSVWEDLGVDQLVFSPLTTQISLEDAKRTMEVFGTHVIPQWDTYPEIHRTTLQRESAAAR